MKIFTVNQVQFLLFFIMFLLKNTENTENAKNHIKLHNLIFFQNILLITYYL